MVAGFLQTADHALPPFARGTELCRGNVLALLAAPERLFAETDGKRARLHERVVDLFVICEAALEDGLPNFVVREVPEQSVG
ncbi:unnamed protein product [Effrenium voratum]|uniref:Uncharacterized protein n=1 Tax=Effrenium voratum TaxID=2562239 RepID=A0AA36JF56_9DINO|nr:unnamed protein product [Effrenium voratum]CAJ1418000.1 unnamed protein product [Effrenium voratum]